MGAVYLSCTVDLDVPGSAGSFGYVGVAPTPVGSRFLRCTTGNAAVAAQPFGRLELTQPDFTGDYIISGYSFAQASLLTEASGPAFGPYAYLNGYQTRFYLPEDLLGEVTVLVKLESSGDVGIEYISGGGAGYAVVYDAGGALALDVYAGAHTATSGDVTYTCHLVSNAPPPELPAFWTNFIGSRERI